MALVKHSSTEEKEEEEEELRLNIYLSEKLELPASSIMRRSLKVQSLKKTTEKFYTYVSGQKLWLELSYLLKARMYP